MKALIVEDEELVRELLASVVTREFEFDAVKEAGDGEAAWALFEQEAFDFVVMDLMLPKLDGLSLARRMLEVNPDIRILRYCWNGLAAVGLFTKCGVRCPAWFRWRNASISAE